MIILCSGKLSDAIAARLNENGIRYVDFDGEVSQLDARSAADSLIGPISALPQKEWPQLRARIAETNRLFIAADSKLSTAQIVNATRDGAQDVLDLKDDDERWDGAFANADASQKLWLQLYSATAKTNTGGIVLGESQATKPLRQTIERVGPMGATVLIMGESRAGKERVAQALHEAGGGVPFHALNCAAIPKAPLESELFGLEKGAFSGAVKDKPDVVEQAAGGTLFLDEIGEMDVALQPKMLRFLETRKARRVVVADARLRLGRRLYPERKAKDGNRQQVARRERKQLLVGKRPTGRKRLHALPLAESRKGNVGAKAAR